MSDTANPANLYKDKLLTRFKETPPTAPTDGVVSEKACDYIYRAVDRQINKARGVLAYNGLLFASFSLAARSSTPSTASTIILLLASVGAIVALSSCFPLLKILIFNWGAPTDYATAENDVTAVLGTLLERTQRINASLRLSRLATGIAVLLPIIFLSELLLVFVRFICSHLG